MRVKVLGVALHAVSAALLARVNAPSAARLGALSLLAACLPLSAYGASGMETPLATLLCTIAVVYNEKSWAPLFAGLAASVRPELMPWAATVACGLPLVRRARPSVVVLSALVSAGPFTACAVARRVAFGHFTPLALMAKPSDVTHGALYAVAALLACALPVLLLTTKLRALPGAMKVVVVAFVAHVVAIIAAGGDSMPYARLLVPVVPSLLLVHLHLARISSGPVFWLRSASALALGAYVTLTAGPRGRHVMRDRADLVARAEPVLRGARHVAAVDVGWVSAATEADIVDLAGLTDPEIAALPGGHTSKRVSGSMLLDRDVDLVVLYVNPLPDAYAHVVGARLARDPVFTSHYDETGSLPLGASGAGYAVFARH